MRTLFFTLGFELVRMFYAIKHGARSAATGKSISLHHVGTSYVPKKTIALTIVFCYTLSYSSFPYKISFRGAPNIPALFLMDLNLSECFMK
jgi:hypothetical protein